MPSDELKDHASTAAVDYYELLGVNFETSEADIRRAYRRTALKYHPDKNVGKPEIIEKFHLLQIAYDVLSDPTYKNIYDNVRQARKQKEERDQAITGKRKQMIDDLERREAEGRNKRKQQPEDDGYMREIQRLAADGKRRMMEKQAQLARERLEEEERLDREKNGYTQPQSQPTMPVSEGGTAVPELDRSVKAVWSLEGDGQFVTKEKLTEMFQAFGKIESVFLLNPKKKRLGDQKSKSLVVTGVIVYFSIVSACTAIDEAKNKTDGDFKLLHSVYWASNTEPTIIHPPYGENTPNGPNSDEIRSLRLKTIKKRRQEDQKRKAAEEADAPQTPSKPPSFASFTPSLFKTPNRDAERERLMEQIRKQDAEDDAKGL